MRLPVYLVSSLQQAIETQGGENVYLISNLDSCADELNKNPRWRGGGGQSSFQLLTCMYERLPDALTTTTAARPGGVTPFDINSLRPHAIFGTELNRTLLEEQVPNLQILEISTDPATDSSRKNDVGGDGAIIPRSAKTQAFLEQMEDTDGHIAKVLSGNGPLWVTSLARLV